MSFPNNRKLLLGFCMTFGLFYSSHFGDALRMRLCIVESVHTAVKLKETCPLLLSSPSEIECVIGRDRFHCLQQVKQGIADFTVLESEDLLAASLDNEANILVTTELRFNAAEEAVFEMVVVTKKEITSLWEIKNRRFCHPGYDVITNQFSTYFENWVIPRECDPDKTLLENRFSALSNFFEAACIAGPWSADSDFDKKLKSKYKNLCALCDNPAGCYTGDRYHGPEGAVLCLTDGQGDVSWSVWDNIRYHFQNIHEDKPEQYNFLCPDGTFRSFKSKPCFWISRPWPVVVSRSEVAERVEEMIGSLNRTKENWKFKLYRLLASYQVFLQPYNRGHMLLRPEDFLRNYSGFLSANDHAACHPSRRIEWCISSNVEAKKCEQIRQASFAFGLEPAVSCLQQPTRQTCLEYVRDGHADLFVISPDEEFHARKMGLKAILQTVSSKRQHPNKVVALVNRNSHFNSLQDLKGARACFTGFESVGWNAFVSIMRSISKVNCVDSQFVSNFFKDSCVIDIFEADKSAPSNLASLCNGETKNKELTTFECLSSGRADVAFVNLNALKDVEEIKNQTLYKQLYRPVCSDQTQDEYKCFLAWVSLGTVVAHENITEVRRDEIQSLLLEMDKLFGKTYVGKMPSLNLYNSYNTNTGVIFSNGTQYLIIEEENATNLNGVKSYTDIVNDLVKKMPCNGMSILEANRILIIFYIFVFLLKIIRN